MWNGCILSQSTRDQVLCPSCGELDGAVYTVGDYSFLLHGHLRDILKFFKVSIRLDIMADVLIVAWLVACFCLVALPRLECTVEAMEPHWAMLHESGQTNQTGKHRRGRTKGKDVPHQIVRERKQLQGIMTRKRGFTFQPFASDSGVAVAAESSKKTVQ